MLLEYMISSSGLKQGLSLQYTQVIPNSQDVDPIRM